MHDMGQQIHNSVAHSNFPCYHIDIPLVVAIIIPKTVSKVYLAILVSHILEFSYEHHDSKGMSDL